MDARSGKQIRLGRVLRPTTGRGIVVATSHGMLTGPPAGQRTRAEILERFPQFAAADAVMVSPGMLSVVEDLFVGRDAPGLVIEQDWKSWNRGVYAPLTDGRSEGATGSVVSIEDVAAAGGDAVMTYLYFGHLDQQLEREEITRNAAIARQCERLGIALIVEPRSAREGVDPDARSATTLAFACRLSAELGADVVKCVWPDGGAAAFAEITDTCLVPVLLAGGPGGETPDESAALAREAVDAGGAGVMFGRKIYRSADPAATIAALRAVVHGEV